MAATITTTVKSRDVRTPALPSGAETDTAGGKFDVEFLFTDFRLDPDGPCLYQMDKTGREIEKPVRLSHNGHALLELLIERKGKVVPWADIFDRVWHVGPKDMDQSNIHVLIHELRRILGEGCIETHARHGYRLAVEVIERQRPSLKQKDEPAITTLYGVSPERLQQMIKEAIHQHWSSASGRNGPAQQSVKSYPERRRRFAAHYWSGICHARAAAEEAGRGCHAIQTGDGSLSGAQSSEAANAAFFIRKL